MAERGFVESTYDRILDRKPEKEERTPAPKVVTGKVKVKKSDSKTQVVFEHLKGIATYILTDFIIPTARDAVVSAVEMAVYNGDPPRKKRRGETYINYGTFSSGQKREMSRQARASHSFNAISMDRREDADMVLDNLLELVDRFGVASVADYYDLVGVEQAYTDVKYGWTNLGETRIRKTLDGWIIDLPRPILLD